MSEFNHVEGKLCLVSSLNRLCPLPRHTHVSHQADVEQQDALSYNDVNNRSHGVVLSRQQKKNFTPSPNELLLLLLLLKSLEKNYDWRLKMSVTQVKAKTTLRKTVVKSNPEVGCTNWYFLFSVIKCTLQIYVLYLIRNGDADIVFQLRVVLSNEWEFNCVQSRHDAYV